MDINPGKAMGWMPERELDTLRQWLDSYLRPETFPFPTDDSGNDNAPSYIEA